MASRSRTHEFVTLRERLRGNRRAPVELGHLRGDKVLLKKTSNLADDGDSSSVENSCSITVAPTYMAIVDALNDDMATIRSKRVKQLPG